MEVTLKNYRCFSDEHPANFLIQPGFTAFIGVNNSGKSSLLRFFYEFRGNINVVSGNLPNALTTINGLSLPGMIKDTNQFLCNKNQRDFEFSIKSDIRGRSGNLAYYPFNFSFVVNRRTNQVKVSITSANGIVDPKNIAWKEGYYYLSNIPSIFMEPIAELLSDLVNSLYIGPFRNAINIGSNDNYYDIQIGQSFIKNWRSIKTGNSSKSNEAALQLTEDIRKIFSYDQLEINPSDDDTTLQLFINSRSFKLSDVGAGLAQFILILANAAIKRPAYIFIDEPELNLHPSLQLDFLTTLGSYAKKGVFFATHNIGLARAAADRIYTLKSDYGTSEIRPLESTTRLAELAGELSYSGYRELGFDTILLVEGVNEVKTIHQFLRLLKKDHKILLIPMGGSQMINSSREYELSELTRIPAKFYALLDSEKLSADAPLSKNHEDFRKICSHLDITCHILERRAIENYLTDESIKQELGPKYSALGPYELLSKELGWSKTDNWRIARRITFKDIEKTDLGKFLLSL